MEIKRIGSQPSEKGPADYFSGTVRVDYLFQPKEPARASGAGVTFEPGARTAWHSHPLGQTLIVTAGCDHMQRWGGPVDEIHPGVKPLSRRRGERSEGGGAGWGEGRRISATLVDAQSPSSPALLPPAGEGRQPAE